MSSLDDRPTIVREKLLSDNKISLSGDLFRFEYKHNEPPASGVAPLCDKKGGETDNPIPRERKRSFAKLEHSFPLGGTAVKIFHEPKSLAAELPPRRRYRKPMFTDEAAVGIIKELHRTAAADIDNSISMLRGEMRNGRLREIAPLEGFLWCICFFLTR